MKDELQSGKDLTEEQREAILMISEIDRQIDWIKEVFFAFWHAEYKFFFAFWHAEYKVSLWFKDKRHF